MYFNCYIVYNIRQICIILCKQIYKMLKKLAVYFKKGRNTKLICGDKQKEITLKANQKIDIEWD